MAGKLTARGVATAKPGRHGDGDGLWLVVASSGARKWVFRFTFAGRVTEMGLGAAGTVPLAQARDLALGARRTVASGKNPILERKEAGRAQKAMPTFGEVADALIAAKQSEWRNEKHRAQWAMTLGTYAGPLRPCPSTKSIQRPF
jgi:Arm DNA-binding domain